MGSFKSWPRGHALLATFGLASAASACRNDQPDEIELVRRPLGAFNVVTRNYNSQRTGANLGETVLTTSNVDPSSFGKLFELPVDDQIYAGVLYASDVTVAGASHNVLYTATVNNSVYAFDADSGALLWQRNFNNGFVPVFHTDVGQACQPVYQDMSGNIGIVGTPVIDPAAGTLFAVTRTRENGVFKQRLRALDISDGSERVSARDIGAISPQPINPQTNHQHAALALSQGKVYVAWSSHCDTGPYSGRVVAFDASDLSHLATFNSTSSSNGMAGIWMAGAAPVIDGSGNLFYATGNGARNGTSQFGESIVKLSATLTVVGHFTPSNWPDLNGSDSDLGSSGPIVVPGTSSIVMGGKGGGTCYLVDMTAMGGANGVEPDDTQIKQKWQCVDFALRPGASHHLHNAMVAWSSAAGLNLYTWGENDFLRVWRFNGSTGRFNTPAVMTGNVAPNVGMPGGMMTLSASGSTAGTAVLWASLPISGDANQDDRPGVLRAFNAENVTQQLWNSTMVVGDDTGEFSKGSIPVVASGRVYLGSLSGRVNVYGLRSGSPDPDRTEGGAASGTGTACNGSESVNEAYDNVLVRPDGTTSKWCLQSAPSSSVPISTVYNFAGSTAFAITRYALTTGNDADDRDPRDWTFQGCLDDSCSLTSSTGWVTLDTRTNQFPLGNTARFQTNSYSFSNATAYQQYRLRFTANNGNTTRFQVAEIQMFNGGGSPGDTDRTEGGTPTGNATACAAAESVVQAYDNRMSGADFSKWCVTRAPSATNPVSTAYDFAGPAVFAINRYTITTGNDAATRDPRRWSFQGCPDSSCLVGSATGWVTLDTRTDQFIGAARFQTNSYTFPNTTAYQQYRLRVTANHGATTRFQVSEIQMF